LLPYIKTLISVIGLTANVNKLLNGINCKNEDIAEAGFWAKQSRKMPPKQWHFIFNYKRMEKKLSF
jgi:hypothetical protein